MLWQTLYIGWIVVEILIAVLTRTKRGSGDVQDRGTMPLLWITIALAMTAAGFARYYFATIVPFHVPTLATALILLGLFIRITAVLSLGKAFSANVAIRESQSLNQSGFYRFSSAPLLSGIGNHIRRRRSSPRQFNRVCLRRSTLHHSAALSNST